MRLDIFKIKSGEDTDHAGKLSLVLCICWANLGLLPNLPNEESDVLVVKR